MEAPKLEGDEVNVSARFQQEVVQTLATEQGANLFQFQPVPPDTPGMQRTVIEKQRQDSIPELLGYVSRNEKEEFDRRGTEVGLTDPNATWRTAQEAYLQEAKPIFREKAREAQERGDGETASLLRRETATINGRIASQEPTPAEQDAKAASLTREDAEFYAAACDTPECRQDLLNAMTAEGYHTQTLFDLTNEWELPEQKRDESLSGTLSLSMRDRTATQPFIMDVVMQNMRQQLMDMRNMQQEGKSQEEIRRSASYRQFAAANGTRRADQAMAAMATGQTADDVATDTSNQIYTRHLLDSGSLHVVVPRRAA
jgi:cellulose biosynthesis protein BcsQ